MSPFPSSHDSRPTPPGVGGNRPTPPRPDYNRPTPPRPDYNRPTPPSPRDNEEYVGSDLMSYLARKVDRNNNDLIDENEGKFVGSVGNNNGVNGLGETTRALNGGSAALYGFQLLRNAAEALAKSMAGGDPYIGRHDFNISDAAKARLDDNRDGRISREELADGLVKGGLGVNAGGIMTSNEAKDRYGARPTPPAPDHHRPTPPPVWDRPTPPRPDYDRPLPPRVYGRTPTEVSSRFEAAHGELKRVYNSTSMSKVDYESAARRMVSQAVDELVLQTADAPFAARKVALDAIYNSSPMTKPERDDVEKRLLATAVDQLLSTSFPSWAATKLAVDGLYNGSSMTKPERDGLEKRFLGREIEKLCHDHYSSYPARRAALEALYNASTMTRPERDEIGARMDREEAARFSRPY